MDKYDILKDLYMSNLELLINTIHKYNLLKEECKENVIMNSMNDMKDMYNEKIEEHKKKIILFTKIIKEFIDSKQNTVEIIEYLNSLTTESINNKDISTKEDFLNTIVKINEFLTVILSIEKSETETETENSES